MGKKDMIYFANLDYEMILNTKDIKGLEDAVLVHCEQAVEKYMKYLLLKEQGVKDTSHAISRMNKELQASHPELKKYSTITRILKDSFFDRRYETENYENLTREEFEELLKESLELIEVLKKLCTSYLGTTNVFSK